MEDEVLGGPLARSMAAVLLYLTWLRAGAIVSTALAERFPTYAEWEQFMDDPDVRRDVERLASVLEEIRAASSLGMVYDLKEAQAVAGRESALDALESLAKRLEVEPEDLLSVLLHA